LAALTTPWPTLAAPTTVDESRWWAAIRRLREKYARIWWETSCETPTLGPPVSPDRRRHNARESELLIEKLAREIEKCPPAGRERAAWRRGMEARVRDFGTRCLGWPSGYQDLLFADEFYDSTRDFVRRARDFCPSVRIEDVTQALRNVWIANSLQMLFDLPVRLSPSIFAYSMLYPWTDNYLDDPAVASDAKAGFNERLERRLAGDAVAARSEYEAQVLSLVQMIEQEHPRREHPGVFLSLLSIQRAQVESLAQQRALCPYEADLLGISVEKGGSSVLVDAYLAAGRLTRDEADFAFGYGVFLQLLDDLQDATVDRTVGHATIYSVSAGRQPLDRLVARLQRFVQRVIDEAPRFAGEAFADRKDLIRRNCTFLLVAAAAENPALCSRAFLASLQEGWAFDFAAMRALRVRAHKRYRMALQRLSRRRGVASPFDLLADSP
jgi:hypothetical protein